MAGLDERQIRWLLAGMGLGSFVLLLALEIVTEADEISLLDLVVDALALLLTISAAVGVALLAQRVQAQHEEKAALVRDLELARAEGESWRAKVQSSLNGIRTEIANQFREWGMTAAEQEIGLLIRKADLPGKTAFSAYFLEDLFASDSVTDGRPAGSAPAGCPTSEPGRAAAVSLRAADERDR